jgi:glycosyltransferase involved in cell wall biosynthesis
MDKTVYILMATYNGDKFIKEQIESILNQTYQNWKLIIHDDNSKDNTVKIIKEYIYKYPEKIVFIDDKISTGGAKENFTYLLNKIDDNYDYVMFCDQDDVWLENKIKLTLDKMLEVEKHNKNKPVLIHTDLKVVDEKLRIISESMFKYQKLNLSNQYDIKKIAIENIITGCTMMLNKNLAVESKCIPKEAIMHDWWIAIITLREKGVIEFLNKSTIMYRQHSINTIGAKKVNLLYYAKKLLKLKEVISSYKTIYIQYKKANIYIGLYNFIITKLLIVIKKAIQK